MGGTYSIYCVSSDCVSHTIKMAHTVATMFRVQLFIACAANPDDFDFLNEDQMYNCCQSLGEVVHPWEDDFAIVKNGLFHISLFPKSSQLFGRGFEEGTAGAS